MQDVTELCHYPELIGRQLRLELYFGSPLVILTEVIVMGERMPSVAVDRFGVAGRKFEKDNTFSEQIFDRIRLLKYRYIR